MTELVFAWPPSVLSPNNRSHWSVKARAAKAYRADCWAITKEANLILPDSEKLALWIDFYPPDKRQRDDDNMIASFKSGRDGMADALGINDKRFRIFPYVQDKIGGMVKVRITNLPEAEEPIKLTKRQSEIVELKALGKNNDVIARKVGIARKTVDAHLCQAIKRCNCKTWEELGFWSCSR